MLLPFKLLVGKHPLALWGPEREEYFKHRADELDTPNLELGTPKIMFKLYDFVKGGAFYCKWVQIPRNRNGIICGAAKLSDESSERS